MKTTQIIIITIIAALLLILTGCDNTDGQVELKESKKELSEFPERKNWSVTDVEGYGE
tara:strand:+ start:266 stop:439 length:174 start_codon:yes stop_codon:yes gene_type:complete